MLRPLSLKERLKAYQVPKSDLDKLLWASDGPLGSAAAELKQAAFRLPTDLKRTAWQELDDFLNPRKRAKASGRKMPCSSCD